MRNVIHFSLGLGLIGIADLHAQTCCTNIPPPISCPYDKVLEWVPAPLCRWYCQFVSPIIIDVEGNGYNLTDADDGVWFDFFGTGQEIHLSWTARGSDDAFLALDRNGDGFIDSAKELFGNVTEQPPSNEPNGFLALAVFDDPRNGGNGDGIIDARDSVFSRLRLWQDKNHDGVSTPDELHTLPELGIKAIHLNYRESRHVDNNGNQFRYRAVVDSVDSEAGREAYDVFLVPDSGTTASTKTITTEGNN
jgi:hypothetical protein